MKINLNWLVFFREQPAGRKFFDAAYKRNPEEARKRITQHDGRMKMMLWEFMQVYGPGMRMGFTNVPVETEIELVDPWEIICDDNSR